MPNMLVVIKPLVAELYRQRYGSDFRPIASIINRYLLVCQRVFEDELDRLMLALDKEDPNAMPKVNDLLRALVDYKQAFTGHEKLASEALAWSPIEGDSGEKLIGVVEKNIEDPELIDILDKSKSESLSMSRIIAVFERYAYKPCASFSKHLEPLLATLQLGSTRHGAVKFSDKLESAIFKFAMCRDILAHPKENFAEFKSKVESETCRRVKSNMGLKLGLKTPPWYGRRVD